MKKLILSLIAIGTFGFTSVAFNQIQDTPVVQEQQQEQKTEILMKDLPEPVKKGWEKTEYKDENVEKIYRVKSQTEEYIEFVVQGEENKMAVHFDLAGKLLREKVIDTK